MKRKKEANLEWYKRMVEPSFFFWFFFLAREMRRQRQIPAVRAPTALTMRRKKRKQLPGKENVDTNSDQKVVTTTTNSDLPQLDCSICFEKITSAQGELNSCTHLFCFECIKTWAAKSNLCPLCKNRFTVINKKLVGDCLCSQMCLSPLCTLHTLFILGLLLLFADAASDSQQKT